MQPPSGASRTEVIVIIIMIIGWILLLFLKGCSIGAEVQQRFSILTFKVRDYEPTKRWFALVPAAKPVYYMRYLPEEGQNEWPALMSKVGKKVTCRQWFQNTGVTHDGPYAVFSHRVMLTCGDETFTLAAIGSKER